MHRFDECEKRRRTFVTIKRLTACRVSGADELINLLICHLDVAPTNWSYASIALTKRVKGMHDSTGDLIHAILPFVTGAGDIRGGGGPVSDRRSV